MQITVRTLLIFTASVGVVLGQARLTFFVGAICLLAEHLVLGYFVPLRLSLWRSFGIMAGISLGLVVWYVTMKWTEINPLSFPTLLESQSSYAAWIEKTGRFLAYCYQVGALVGGTGGMILGEARWQSQQRTAAASGLSDSQ